MPSKFRNSLPIYYYESLTLLSRGVYVAYPFSSKLEYVPIGKLCGPLALGPSLDQARRFAADELPISLDLVESDKDQTLGGRV